MSLSLVKPLRLTEIKRNTFEIQSPCLKPGTNQNPQLVSKISTTLLATVEVQGVALLVLEVAILVVLNLTLVLAMDLVPGMTILGMILQYCMCQVLHQDLPQCLLVHPLEQ